MCKAWKLFVVVCLAFAMSAVVEAKPKLKKVATPPVEPALAPGGVNKDDPSMPPLLPGGKGKTAAVTVKSEVAKVSVALTLRFAAPGKRVVLACGRRIRGETIFRENADAAARKLLRPARTEIAADGKTAFFSGLPPDVYDFVVVDLDAKVIYEGMDLLADENRELTNGSIGSEIRQAVTQNVGTAEHRRCERVATDGLRGAALLQQALPERAETAAGEAKASAFGLQFLDVVWLSKVTEAGGWQVTGRQRLYWRECAPPELYKCRYRAELQGLRLGADPKDMGLVLAADIKAD